VAVLGTGLVRSKETLLSIRTVWFIATLFALLFVSQNLETVEISLLWGRPVEAPLALVIGGAFFLGLLCGIGLVVERRFRKSRKTDGADTGYYE